MSNMPSKQGGAGWLPSVFNDFFGNEWITKASSVPAVNIKETPTEYQIELAAPGLTKDDFKVSVTDDNHLVVSVQKEEKHEEKDKEGKYLRRDFSYTQFAQSMILPDNIDKEKIEAKAEHGVLTIEIPKKPENPTGPKKEIKVK